MWPEHYFQILFNFQVIFCKMESEEASVLIWTNVDSSANTYRTLAACFKKFVFQ